MPTPENEPRAKPQLNRGPLPSRQGLQAVPPPPPTLGWRIRAFFTDPRTRGERLFLGVFVPTIFTILGVVMYFLYRNSFNADPDYVASTPPRDPAASPVIVISASSAEPGDFDRGVAALQRGDLANARTALLAALESGQHRTVVLNALGSVEMADARPREAIPYFTEAIAGGDRNPIFHLNRSEAYRATGNHSEAVADLQEALALDRLNPLYTNKILLARIEAGEEKAVAAEIQNTISLGIEQYQTDWLGGAAAMEARAGYHKRASELLAALRERVPPLAFRLIFSDRVFAPYLDEPLYAKFRAEPAATP